MKKTLFYYWKYQILTVVFLVLSLTGTLFLVKLNQDNRNRATPTYNNYEDCRKEKGKVFCDNLFGLSTPTGANEELKLSYTECGKNGNPGAWCDACGGFCISMKSLTCDQAGIKKCGEYPVHGSTVTGVGSCTPPSGGQSCVCSGTNVCFINKGQCDNANHDGLCAVWELIGSPKTNEELKKSSTTTEKTVYYCKDRFLIENNNSCNTPAPANFDVSCYCGTIQIDRGNGFTTESMKCGCSPTPRPTRIPTSTPKPTSTPRPTRTPAPTRTPIPTRTSTPTLTPTGTRIPTSIPTYPPTETPTSTQTPTGTQAPTNTPTNTPVPTDTPVPTATPVYTAQGPSPTRIILPNSGFDFPIQALSVVGVITTLLGLLILL